jgi:hypothetical protein
LKSLKYIMVLLSFSFLFFLSFFLHLIPSDKTLTKQINQSSVLLCAVCCEIMKEGNGKKKNPIGYLVHL